MILSLQFSYPIFTTKSRKKRVKVGWVYVMDTQGKLVTFYWTKDRRFFMRFDGVDTQLNPWLGVEMEATKNKDWRREKIGEYEPNDLLGYLERIGEYVSIQRKTARLR